MRRREKRRTDSEEKEAPLYAAVLPTNAFQPMPRMARLKAGVRPPRREKKPKGTLRGYPETLSPCGNEITQHLCGNETRGDRKERACSS